MSQALTHYHALYESIRARRRKKPVPKGLDGLFSLAKLKLTHRRMTPTSLRAEAEQVDALAPNIRGLTEASLDAAIAEAREPFVRAKVDDTSLRRAMALVREVARRETGEEPFLVQLMGAMALARGHIIEMLTGEGKTLTGSIAAPLLAWRHRQLHVLTVNDYLARRDAESRSRIYKRCLITVGAIQQEHDQRERGEIYARGIVYGTPKQITADWLRDQIRLGKLTSPWAGRQAMVLTDGVEGRTIIPGLRSAMVDEADAVLIDEGVVPLIIARSRRTDDMAEVYRGAARVAASLDEGPDYAIDHLRKRADLTRQGSQRCVQLFESLDEPIWRATRRAEELIRQALIARHGYRRGHQYQIVDGRVVIVDEYTGRFLADRSWEHGLHQAVEAKEQVEITADRETLARMSFQRFFRTYPFLCGMTGTAADATIEMQRVYDRPVTSIPTNRPMIRTQQPTRIFATAESKWQAIADSIEDHHRAGRPVLAGTRSIEASEELSRRLAARGLPHRILNANYDQEESELIAHAGRGGLAMGVNAPGATITVATNMAGRGTDIKPDAGAIQAGGLHVILTEMHTAQRIDRQFIGRAGRQGDPGSAQIFVSLEDELITLYAPRVGRLAAMRASATELPASRPLRALFRHAQRRAEARGRTSRASVLKQDDWIDKHLPGA
jgi:preprotein translocase subunit SecA